MQGDENFTQLEEAVIRSLLEMIELQAADLGLQSTKLSLDSSGEVALPPFWDANEEPGRIVLKAVPGLVENKSPSSYSREISAAWGSGVPLSEGIARFAFSYIQEEAMTRAGKAILVLGKDV